MTEVDDILVEILLLRGAEYVCLADRANGRIIGEAGQDDSSIFSGVLKLETIVSEFLDSDASDDLEDLMISSRYWYHLIRHVDSFGIPPLLLYLRLRRNRANLAAARRELASHQLNNQLLEILRSHEESDYDNGPTSIPGKSNHPYFTLSIQPELAGLAAAPTYWSDPTHDTNPPEFAPQPLPRRAPASPLPRRAEKEPEPAEPTDLPHVLRQSWAFDRNTMERLVDGLRRMTL